MNQKRFHFDIVFIDNEKLMRRVVIGGIGTKPNQLVWKHIDEIKDIKVEKYVSMRSFLRERYIDITADFKTRLFTNIIRDIGPINTYSIWCHKDSTI